VRWGVSRWTIHRLAKDGRLKKTHIRGSVRFSAAAVAAFEKKAV
jgi:excisionase family DNA binding protein